MTGSIVLPAATAEDICMKVRLFMVLKLSEKSSTKGVGSCCVRFVDVCRPYGGGDVMPGYFSIYGGDEGVV